MNKTIIVVLISIGITIGVLTYTYYHVPSYDEMLNTVEGLMKQTKEAEYAYRVFYEYKINGVRDTMSGLATFNINNTIINWSTTMNELEGTIYNLNPTEILSLMKKSTISQVEDYDSNITCYMLNGYIDETTLKTLVDSFDYARLMACFDKITGFPSQYTVLVIGLNDGALISYNSIYLRIPEANLFNETVIT
ncbi:MAG TPA: hypothetical protein VI790_00045 [Candidatus Nanoarchaeia archaeon]|nr:hypothetical protein [Candidatus Nanoarchaeia archaeon]